MARAPTINLSSSERATLRRIARARTRSPQLAVRAQIVLQAAGGATNARIAQDLGVTPWTVGEWRKRFASERLDGLRDRPRPGRPSIADDATKRALREGRHASRSIQQLARETGLSPSTIARITRSERAGEQPTLQDLVIAVGTDVVGVLAAPAGLDGASGRPVIYDRRDPPALEAGDVLLAVGVDPSSKDATELVTTAGHARAAAVVFKTDAATRASWPRDTALAVLALRRGISWNQFLALLKAATGMSRRTGRSAADAGLGDLFALANAVAAMVGGPAMIVDPDWSVLAYSNLDEPIDENRRRTIIDRIVPRARIDRLHDLGVLPRLQRGDDVVRYEDPEVGAGPRLAVAIRAGADLVGYLNVAEGRRPLGSKAESALREAARIAALHLIRHGVGEDLARRRGSEELRSFLDGSAGAEQLAAAIGADVHNAATVLAFQQRDEAPTSRLLGLAQLHAEAVHRRATCAEVGSRLYVLVPGRATTFRLEALASDVNERASSSLGVALIAGIGRTVPSLHDAAQSRREADEVLNLIASGHSGKSVARFARFRNRIALERFREATQSEPGLQSDGLRTLAEHDRGHGTALVQTLRAYLDAFGDVSAGAKAVQVHPNTFRYRLRRATELSGLDLADPEERLVTQLELHVLAAGRTQ